MAEVHMMSGIAGSGKSRLASSLAAEMDAVYVSSDGIRQQWYGDSAIQGDNSALFTEVRNAVRNALHNGKSVIYDATNLSRRRRIHFIRNDVRGYPVTVHTLCPPLSLCLERNKNRERQVEESVLFNMYKSFEIPFKEEGFTDAHYYFGDDNRLTDRDKFETLLKNPPSYEVFFQNFNRLEGFSGIYELPHDNKKRIFSVSRHTYYTLLEMQKAYLDDPPLKMLWLCVLHDLGKGETKSFFRFNGEARRYAGFEGHEKVSTYRAMRLLHQLGYPLDFICAVARQVQLHHFFHIQSKKNRKHAALLLQEHEQEELYLFQQCNDRAN